MDKVFEKTRELGEALQESPVYLRMKAAEEKAMQNMQAAEMMASYLEKRSQIQEMMEVAFCFLVQGVVSVLFQRLLALKLRIQRIIHAVEGPADLHMQQPGDLTHQGLQNGRDQLHSIILIDTFFECVQNNMLDHINLRLQVPLFLLFLRFSLPLSELS